MLPLPLTLSGYLAYKSFGCLERCRFSKEKKLAESLIIKVGGRGISIQIVFMRRCLTGCLKDETTCHLKKDMTKVVGGMKVQIGQGTIFPVAGGQGA